MESLPSIGSGNLSTAGYQAANGSGAIYDPATVHCIVLRQTQCAQYERDPFRNDTIPADPIGATALKMMKLFPKACGQYNVVSQQNSYPVTSITPSSLAGRIRPSISFTPLMALKS